MPLPVIIDTGHCPTGATQPYAEAAVETERILGLLGVQSGEFGLPLDGERSDGENISSCLLIVALSSSDPT